MKKSRRSSTTAIPETPAPAVAAGTPSVFKCQEIPNRPVAHVRPHETFACVYAIVLLLYA